MKNILLFFCLFSAVIHAANSGSVVQVSRRFRMSALEPQPQKDYFIDIGSRDGVKMGDILEVSRMVPVVNAVSGGQWHLIKVVLGELKVYQLGVSACIAHMESERELSQIPISDYPNVMLGDTVEIKEQPKALNTKVSELAPSSLPFQ